MHDPHDADRQEADQEAIGRADTLGRTEGLDLRHAGIAATSAEHWEGILHNIHFNLHPGELCAVIAAPGAGKEDLIGLLLGARNLSAGSLRLGGKEGLALGSVGYVSPSYELDPTLSVRETLDFGARLRLPHMDDTGRTIRLVNLCQELGLEREMGTRIRALGPGMERAVVLALELMTDPEVLILDEPMHALSGELSSNFMLKLEQVADRGCAVLVFTHPTDAVRRCDAMMVLHQRIIAYFGPPHEALEYFGVESLEQIDQSLKKASPELWHQQCRTSMWGSNFLHRPKPQRKRHHEHVLSGRLDAENWRPMSRADQIVGLLRRVGVRWTRGPRVAITAGAAAAAGAGISSFLTPEQVPLGLAFGAFVLGTASVLTEVIRDRSVLERERYFSLSMFSYLFSLSLVALVSNAAAVALGLVVAEVVRPIGGPLYVHLMALLGASTVGTGLGLLISSLARDRTRARALGSLLMLAQIAAVYAGLARAHSSPVELAIGSPVGFAMDAVAAAARDPLDWAVILRSLVGSATWFAACFVLAVAAMTRRRDI